MTNLSEIIITQHFPLISKVNWVKSQPKINYNLNDKSLQENIKLCAALQPQQLREKSTNENDPIEKKPSRRSETCFEITVCAQSRSGETSKLISGKIEEAEDVSIFENGLLEVKIRYISKDATSFLYSMQEKQETVTRPQL